MKKNILNLSGRERQSAIPLYDSAGTRNWVSALEVSVLSVLRDCPGLPGNAHRAHDFGILPHLPIDRLKVRGRIWGQVVWGESLFNIFVSKELKSPLKQLGVSESNFQSLKHIKGGNREHQLIDSYEWLTLPVLDCFDRERSGYVEKVKCPLCDFIEAIKHGDGLFFHESKISAPLFRIREYPFHVFATADMADLFIRNQWSPIVVVDPQKLLFSDF